MFCIMIESNSLKDFLFCSVYHHGGNDVYEFSLVYEKDLFISFVVSYMCIINSLRKMKILERASFC